MLKTKSRDIKGQPLPVVEKVLVRTDSVRRKGFRDSMARTLMIYCDWLAGQPMTLRDWTNWEIRHTETLLRLVTYGLVWHLDGLVLPVGREGY